MLWTVHDATNINASKGLDKLKLTKVGCYGLIR